MLEIDCEKTISLASSLNIIENVDEKEEDIFEAY